MDVLSYVYPELKNKINNVYISMRAIHQLDVFPTSGLRSYEDQQTVYNKGRDSSGKVIDPRAVVSWAKPGQSYHNYGCAIDSAFKYKNAYGDSDPYLSKHPNGFYLWQEFGRMCRDEGLTWGGDFQNEKQDRPHAQLTFGVDITTMRDLYFKDGLSAVWDELEKRRIELC